MLGRAVLPAVRAKPTVDPRIGLEALHFVVVIHAVERAFGWSRVEFTATVAFT